MSGDELPADDPLNPAVAALRQGVAVPAGLPERTRRRARRQAGIRWGSGALATAAVAVALVYSLPRATPPGQVTFALVAPASTGVSLVGDFNDWDRGRVRLERVRADEWRVTLRLPPGRYRYSYVTDEGQWLADPDAPPAFDEFGTPTSVITVPSET
jgi:hypothetical protein